MHFLKRLKKSRVTLALLWNMGELRSVALLALHLEALGVPAVGLNVQADVRCPSRAHNL